MIKYWFKYTDGDEITRTFDTMKNAQNFIHNEGDHLVEAKRLIDEQWDPTLERPTYTINDGNA
jgi:hypothetical protein